MSEKKVELSFKERVLGVQSELNAPKNRQNKFGGYSYRSCEDIFEAVKPLLVKYDLSLSCSDEIVQIGERYYVKASARLVDGLGSELVVNAFAREAEQKKGMDDSQITGTASSYARKYALNGLFLIDDVKDSDTNEFAEQTGREEKHNESRSLKPITEDELKALQVLINKKGADVSKIVAYYKVKSLKELVVEQYEQVKRNLEKREDVEDPFEDIPFGK